MSHKIKYLGWYLDPLGYSFLFASQLRSGLTATSLLDWSSTSSNSSSSVPSPSLAFHHQVLEPSVKLFCPSASLIPHLLSLLTIRFPSGSLLMLTSPGWLVSPGRQGLTATTGCLGLTPTSQPRSYSDSPLASRISSSWFSETAEFSISWPSRWTRSSRSLRWRPSLVTWNWGELQWEPTWLSSERWLSSCLLFYSSNNCWWRRGRACVRETSLLLCWRESRRGTRSPPLAWPGSTPARPCCPPVWPWQLTPPSLGLDWTGEIRGNLNFPPWWRFDRVEMKTTILTTNYKRFSF